jgi:hypothetical protein
MGTEAITPRDREILRGVANRKRELHHSKRNQQLLEDWLLHNTFRGERPMVHIDIHSTWGEIYPQRLRCEGELARNIETRLWEGFILTEITGDDSPVSDDFFVHWHIEHIPFGLKVDVVNATNDDGLNTLGYKIQHPIDDLEKDFHKLGNSVIKTDKAATMEYANTAADIFGDILPVRVGMNALYAVPTRCVVYLMDMGTMFTAMVDCPDLFHKMMRQYADDMIAYFRFLEANGFTNPTAGSQYLGQSSWCYTDELPREGTVTSRQMWGFMDSQETVGISPAMFDEMVFPYYKMIADEYGLLSYGCCEPVHPFWERSLSKFENLRKISVSPWCDEEYMGVVLRGKKIIFHRKPSSNFLGMGTGLDEAAFRGHIITTLKAARGCTLEITQRDIYNINRDEAKVRRYTDIIREEIVNHW